MPGLDIEKITPRVEDLLWALLPAARHFPSLPERKSRRAHRQRGLRSLPQSGNPSGGKEIEPDFSAVSTTPRGIFPASRASGSAEFWSAAKGATKSAGRPMGR